MTDRELILAYVDGAKSFVQLSSAGLVVPVVLRSEVLGLLGSHPSVVVFLLACAVWLAFLTAIGAGLLYQYAAIKFLEYQSDPKTFVPARLHDLVVVRGPGVAYGWMVVAFYAGALFLVFYSAASFFTAAQQRGVGSP
jgi:hypothetical protein